MSANSIALRLSGMFTLVALLIFLLIGGALYFKRMERTFADVV